MIATSKNILCSIAIMASVAGIGVMAGTSAAQAGAFGAATASIGSGYNPVVTTSTIDLTTTALGDVFLFSGTGQLPAVHTNGSASGVLHYSPMVGTLISDIIANLFSFTDGSSGFYKFDLASVQTISYASSSSSSIIGLYLLGDMYDTNLGLTPTATSLTLSFNSTSGGPFSYSGTLANPPAGSGIPEPASMLLLGAALAGLGFVRRRKA